MTKVFVATVGVKIVYDWLQELLAHQTIVVDRAQVQGSGDYGL
jgi:hypothetical protein